MSQQPNELRKQVRNRYAAAATAVTTGTTATCCGASTNGPVQDMEIGEGGAELYTDAERNSLPPEAVAASLGCGNPLAVADLNEG